MLVIKNVSEYFFVDGSGRTGKTFLYNILFASVRSHEEIVMTIASLEIAALLISGYRIVHSQFKILI